MRPSVSAKYIPFLKKNGLEIYVDVVSMNPVLCEVEFESAGLFENDFAVVKKDGKYGFIDHEGNMVIPNIYDGASDFSEGLALVEIDGSCGFINTQGKIVVPIQYDNAGDFYESYAQVELDNLWV